MPSEYCGSGQLAEPDELSTVVELELLASTCATCRKSSSKPVKSITALPSSMASPHMTDGLRQVRKRQWSLYLPGLCIHLVSATTPHDEVHLILPDFPDALKFQPIVEPPLHEHPVFRNSSTSQESLSPLVMPSPPPAVAKPSLPKLAELINDDKAFENTSTSVAASQMRNALNNLADTVTDPEEKKVQFVSLPSTHWIKPDLHLALRD